MGETAGSDPAPAAAPVGRRLLKLSLGAAGIVFGDIGTSPLYTMREGFSGGLPLEDDAILGFLSCVFWALLIIVTLKYVLLVLRADNRGEGGTLALMALLLRHTENAAVPRSVILPLGLVGAALFYGDGVITPAISVLSAVEGLEIAAPDLSHFVLPITIGILFALFMIQRRGTARVGVVFGPVMGIWLSVLALLGVVHILRTPEVLRAASPIHAVSFFIEYGWQAFLALGAVVLAVTGAEALYADMGHFGRRPIRVTWLGLVLPALALNYFGQGALLMRDPAALANPFYHLVPDWGVMPLLVLATAATIIASQAVISGAFSLSRQAVQLGLLPRLVVRHTSRQEIGQIYMPGVNWTLLAAIIILVLLFRTSSNLATAYGIAVTGAMVTTAMLTFLVARSLWRWRRGVAVAVFGFLLAVDLALFASNALEFQEGGWFPVLIAIAMAVVMSTWRRGRAVLRQRLSETGMSIETFGAQVLSRNLSRVPGTAIFMTGDITTVPHALLHNLKHNKILHERIVMLTVVTEDVPWVRHERRVIVEKLYDTVFRVILRFGFTETPDVPRTLLSADAHGLSFDLMDTSFFLGRETLIPSVRPDLSAWQERLFILLSSNATSATDFFRIPPNRVVELGTQIEI